MADRVIKSVGGSFKCKTIAVLGLAFKPNTDDMRDAPSLDIIPALQAAGAHIRAFDPEGMEEAKKLLNGVEFAGNPYECLQGAHAVVIITEWDQFRALDLERVKAAVKQPVIVDLRNIYTPEEVRAEGFAYVSIGRA